MSGHLWTITLFCRKNVEIPILKSSARIAARLNYVCPQFFPAPGFWSIPDSLDSSEVCYNMLTHRESLCFSVEWYLVHQSILSVQFGSSVGFYSRTL